MASWFDGATSSLRRWWRARSGVQPLQQVQADLQKWFTEGAARELLLEEQALIDESINCLFGYQLLQLGVTGLDLSSSSRIPLRLGVTTQASRMAGGLKSVQASAEQLPLPAESIDLAVLHHLLEFSSDPHQVLREVSRVLISRGHLVIVGFNPFSLTGLAKGVKRLFWPSPQVRYHSLRLGRLLDWLRLLDFEVVRVARGFYRPPLRRRAIMARLHWLEYLGQRWRLPFAGVYVVVVRKDRIPLTPLKKRWMDSVILPGLIAKPVAEMMPDNSDARECKKIRET